VNIRAALSWPGRQLKPIGLASLIGLFSMVINAFWVPTVKPVVPKELSAAGPRFLGEVRSEGDESLDFIFRPLFLAGRRPPETMVVVPAVVDADSTKQADRVALDSYAVVGIFSSGDLAGVIITDTQDQQSRLYIGDNLEGWRLSGTSLRTAYFDNDAGQVASLELTVASSLPPPAIVIAQQVQGGDQSPGSRVDNSLPDQVEDQPSEGGPLTFEKIAQRERRRRQQDQQAAGGEPDN